MSKSGSIANRLLPTLTGLLLFLQSALVITGGAVRVTGSGLGCPTWPECTPGSYLPVEGQAEGALHAWIEFGNRLLTFALLFAALATFIAVFRSRRRDLRFLAATQILGILGQGVLGGITVLTDLNPLAVASHFILSIALIAAATSLHSRRHHAQVRTSSTQVRISRISSLHVSLAFIVLAIGTLVTGTGPHAGDLDAPRLDFAITTITRFHSAAVWLLMITTIIFYLSSDLRFETKRWLQIFFFLALLQGAFGYLQYFLGVPEGLVVAHLLGSVLVWIAAWRIRLSVVRKHA
ncbi:COX15/CtaA family [Candidatus Nanopelagicaceae bacterium]|jgi:cytochrome c oxidase assembly protein subunit 15